jgi:hypothetical protein
MKTCYIIGNGPSHDKFSFDNVPTFGMNYAGFQPTYYVCIDSDVITHHANEIRSYVQGAQIAYLSELLIGVNDLYDGANVQLVGKDEHSFKAEKFMSGFTASYVCLKMAYYLGFDDVHLYGIDHSLDWAHYKVEYPAGAKDRARRMGVMAWHYQLAQNVYTRAGRTITNHSNPSALDKIFRRAL